MDDAGRILAQQFADAKPWAIKLALKDDTPRSSAIWTLSTLSSPCPPCPLFLQKRFGELLVY
jgi:hypothetical protein